MTRELKLKPEFDKSVERFEAWWRHEIVGRPPMMMGAVRTGEPKPAPAAKTFASDRERWMNVEYHVDCATASLYGQTYLGDSYPGFWPNMGPEICATVFGVELEFGDWTNWSKPIVHEPDDWQKVLDTPVDYDNIYWKAAERMADHAIAVSNGDFAVGITDLHGNYDILAALRDPQYLCMDMIDCPELVTAAAAKVTDVYIEQFNRCWARSKAAGYGSFTWCPIYHDGPGYVPSCDFWCMVAPAMGREMIWPYVEKEIKSVERSLFHLDGPNALGYLDFLLACPELDAVQWVYGAGNGTTQDWMHIYKRITDAGKGIEIGGSCSEVLELLEIFPPELLFLHVGGIKSTDEADAFCKDVEKVCARR